MKYLRQVLFVLVLLSLSNAAFSQLKCGLKGGLNLTNVISKDDYANYSEGNKYKLNAHIGGVLEWSASYHFSIETGLFYSGKGFLNTYKVYDPRTNIDDEIRIKYNLNYVVVPLSAVYKLQIGQSQLCINAGPYIAYAVSANAVANKAILGASGNSKEEKLSIGADKTKDFIKPLDAGLNAGVGIEFTNFLVGFNYSLGFLNIASNQDRGTELKNIALGFSIGYKFGRRYWQ